MSTPAERAGRSFIEATRLDRITGVETADLAPRYGRERKNLPKAVALRTIALDDDVATYQIRRGEAVDLLMPSAREADAGLPGTQDKWHMPLNGERFAGVYGGEIVFDVPHGTNRNYNVSVMDVKHIRRHKEQTEKQHAADSPAGQEDGNRSMEEMVSRAGLTPGDSFTFVEKRVTEDPKTGFRSEHKEELGVYGVVFQRVEAGHLWVNDRTGASDESRPLSTYREILSLKKSKPLPYPGK